MVVEMRSRHLHWTDGLAASDEGQNWHSPPNTYREMCLHDGVYLVATHRSCCVACYGVCACWYEYDTRTPVSARAASRL